MSIHMSTHISTSMPTNLIVQTADVHMLQVWRYFDRDGGGSIDISEFRGRLKQHSRSAKEKHVKVDPFQPEMITSPCQQPKGQAVQNPIDSFWGPAGQVAQDPDALWNLF